LGANVITDKKILAIVPARAGSKRLPGKNSKIICNKPLVQWTIEAALGCEEITEVFVSTDCEKIAEIANECGCDVPFLRPDSISGDTATAIDVVKHTMAYMNSQRKNFDYIVWLQPTSPLRTSQDIKGAISTLVEKNASSIISVCECEHSPLWTNKLGEGGSMEHFLSQFLKQNPRSQALPTYYRLNGAIYIAEVKPLLEQGTFYLSENLFAYIMNSESSVDIDHRLDFKLAEILLEERLQ